MKKLSELSNHTLSKYFVKSVKDHDKLLAQKKKLGGKSTPEISARMNKRAAGLDRALPRLQHEDVEPIEELNKDTLYSYRKKAEKDETDKFRASAKAMKADDSVTANKTSHQAIKRMQGIEKADDRLAKEEVEQIDEISKDLAGKYIDAVHKKNSEAGRAAAKPGWQPPDTKTFTRNMINRSKGLRQATDRKFAKEETEMTEKLTEALRLVSKHGNEGDVHTAKVYKDKDWDEYQVHHYKHGKHMGEGPMSHHDDKADAQQTAEFEVKRQNAKHAAKNEEVEQISESGDTHGVFMKGGSIGDHAHGVQHPVHGKLTTTHKSPEEAHARAKRLNDALSPGEKSYYKIKYHVKPLGEEVESVEEAEQIDELSSDTLNSYMKKKKKVINKQTRFGGTAKDKDVANYRKAWSKRDKTNEEVEMEDEVVDELENSIEDSIESTIEHAFNGDAAEMRDELYAAIQGKISQALEAKKQELANSLVAGSITKEE